MATKQKLGIELELSLDSKFGDLIKQIEGAFSKVDLKGFEAKIQGVEAKVGKVSKAVEELAKKVNKDPLKLNIEFKNAKFNEEMLKIQETVARTGKVFTDASGKLTTPLQDMMNKGSQITAIINNTNKAYSSLGTQIMAANKNTEAANKATIRGFVEKGNAIIAAEKNTATVYTNLGNQILAINKNTEAANKATAASYIEKGNSIIAAERNTYRAMIEERKKALQQLSAMKMDRSLETKEGSDFLAGLGKQGLKTFNGDIIPKTYITDIDKAREAANKYNEALKVNKEQLRQGQEYLSSLAKQGLAHWNGQTISVSEYNKRLRGTTRDTNDLIGSFGRMAKTLTEFYLIRGVLFTIRNQLRDVATTLLDFNQSLYDTAAISGGSVESLKQMEQAAFNIATTSRFSATQVMEMTKILAQAGVAAKDLPLATKVTAIFATGANATPAQAVDLMTTSMNVWNITANDSARVANTLTAALNASKLEAGGLSTAFNYLANQGAQMGMSLEEVSGIIATLSNVGVKPSTIGTGASGLLAAFAAPAPRLRAMLKEFKVGLDEVNPMTHTFAEIIGRLEKAAIPTEAILASLDKRIARTLVSALNAGQQGFELMTRAVTGTDAALIANYKVMEGVRAKFNVIKSEFAESVKSLTGGLAGPLSAALTALRALVLGLGTDGAKFSIVAAGITVALAGLTAAIRATAIETSVLSKALLTLKALNPEVWLIVAAVAAATAGIAYFGKKKLEAKEASEAFSKALAGEADKYQQAEMGLIGIMNGLDKTQKSKKGYIALTTDQSTELVKLINKYPKYLEGLDLEHLTFEKLIKATDKLYEARVKLIGISANAFNRENFKIKNAEAGITQDRDWGKVTEYSFKNNLTLDPNNPLANLDTAVAHASERVRTQAFSSKEEALNLVADLKTLEAVVARTKSLRNLIAESQDLRKVLHTTIDGNYVIGPDGNARLAPTPQTKKSGGDTYDPRAGANAAKAEKTAGEVDTDVLDAINGMKRKLAQLSVEEKKLKLDQLKEDLKTDKELLAFKMLSAEAIQEEAAEKEIEARIRIKKKLAQDLNGGKAEIDETGVGFITAGKNIAPEREAELRDLATKQLLKEQQAIANEATLRLAKANNTKLPNEPVDRTLGIYSSDKQEKAADRLLQTTSQRLNLEKDMAKTASELRAIELQILDAQIKNTEDKAIGYQLELQSIETSQVAQADMEAVSNRYVLIVEKLEQIKALEEEIRRKRKEEAETGAVANFQKGATKGLLGMGDVKTNSEQLGLDVANTGLNGMVDLLDQSISKLAKLEWSWKSFRQTLGDVMQDIAGQLQKYYIKLMVIWAAEQLVGLFSASSSGGGKGAPMQSGGYTLGANGLSAPMQFANGGQVVGGIPGKDSVPILAMPGEFMVRQDVVNMMGLDFMRELNAGRVQKLANGGVVGGYSGSSTSKGETGMLSLSIYNVLNPEDLPQTTDNQIINVINMDIAKRGSTLKTIKMALA